MVNVIQNKTIRDSLERVDQYLMKKRNYITITQISKDLNLHSYSIKKCVKTLDKFNRVDIATNGNVVLVRYKENKNGK